MQTGQSRDENAVAAAERAARSDNERGRRQAARYLVIHTCSVCHGTRPRPEALASRLDARTMAEIAAMSLDEVPTFARERRPSCPPSWIGSPPDCSGS